MKPVLTHHHPKAQCIDLRATFGRRFRYAWDDAYEAERPEFRKVEAPWLTQIPGRFGHVFPWGGRVLAAYTSSRYKMHDLLALPGVTGRVVGDREAIVTFDVDLIDQIDTVLLLRHPRPLLTPERKAALVSAGSRYRIQPGVTGGLQTPGRAISKGAAPSHGPDAVVVSRPAKGPVTPRGAKR